MISMIRGSCQQFRFQSPYPLSQLKTIRITFWQIDDDGNDIEPIPAKLITDCTENGTPGYIYVTLHQRETLAFKSDRQAFVQFRALPMAGCAFSSHPTPITVYPTKDETILE